MSDPNEDPANDEEIAAPRLSKGELQSLAVKGASWTLIHTLVSLPLGFLVNILIARTLGVVDFGRLAYLTSIMAIAQSIMAAGVVSGLIQFGSKAHAAGRTDSVQQLLSGVQAIRLATVVPVLSLVIVSVADIGPWMIALAVVFGIILPTALASAPDTLTLENKTARNAQVAMVVNILSQVAVVAAVLVIGTADSVWVARLIAGSMAFILAAFYVLPAYRHAILRPRFHRMPSGFWRFSIPAGIAAALATMVNSRVEVVVLTGMSELEAAGVFALAFGLATHLFAPAGALVGPLVPAVSGLREVAPDSVSAAFTRTVRAASTAIGAIVGLLIPSLALLVPVIYGDEFVNVPPVLVALGVGGGLMVIVGPLNAFASARLRGTWLLTVNLVSLAVALVLMFTLIPILGVWGAVIANAAACLTQFISFLVGEARNLRIRAGAVIHSLLPYVVGASVTVASWAATSALGLHPIPGAIVSFFFSALMILGLLWLLRVGLTRADVSAVEKALPARVHRLTHPFLILLAASRRER